MLGVAAVVGHTFPLYRKGGKGVAAAAGMLIVLFPLIVLGLGVVWVVIARVLKKASLASLVTAIAFPVLVAVTRPRSVGDRDRRRARGSRHRAARGQYSPSVPTGGDRSRCSARDFVGEHVMQQVRKAVIPAAGLGTRFLPATKSSPKEMLPVVDKPAIQYVVEEAVQAGITDILIITGRNKRAVEDHFDRNFELEHYLEAGGKHDLLKEVQFASDLADIHYVRQRDPLGLGHAVSVARHHVGDESFAVLLADDIMVDEASLLRSMLDEHDRYGRS